MKTFKFIFLLIGVSLMGCSDLEEKPIGILAPDGFFQTTKDIQTAVEGAKTHAINEKFWGRKLSIALMLRSDMVNLQSDQTRRVEHDMLTTLTDNGMISEFWLKTYQGIAAANLAIEGAAQVDVADDLKNPIVAQAYFIRAFYYFHLVRQFGAIPYLDANVTDAEAGGSIGRTPAAEVYANIIKDLEFAKTWLPPTQPSAGIPSKAAASSYLSLVYLTMAGTSDKAMFQKAYDEAVEVITTSEYGLDLDSNFQNLFNANVIDGSPEPIFALDYNNVEASDNAYDQVAPMTGIRGDDRNSGGGWSVAVPTEAVYASFDQADYRTRVSFEEEANIGGTFVTYENFTISGHVHARNTPYIAKYTRYPGPFARGSGRATSHNYSMIRFAEVLLIAAEAGVEIGQTGPALSYLNRVRTRARLGGAYKTGADVEMTFAPSAVPADLTSITVADVLEERRIELAFEGKRWYDIARRRLGDAGNGDVFGAGGYEGAKPDFDENDYLMPLPGDELDRNPNLQPNNPGYN
ncbi:RagB/SusD family nutrient uptake outer membrane protein [Algibacter mikhailovii]|uniref:Membrane protein n=1 Tax=Algibacter mikhailovii TaxID=425498 RepID=A0A918VD08_9FLAO|nr:RagB/SusD family nutrient uptake outer membrane protein [Algibacter mikhailovii]GGZ87817.1 membrane protein [Algibacter mikhailovii]